MKLRTNRRTDYQTIARAVGVALLATLITGKGWSYEQATHAALTREAYVRSKLGLPSPADATVSDLALRLGLGSKQVVSLGTGYIDIGANGPSLRLASPPNPVTFSSKKIDDTNRVSPSITPTLDSLPGWLMLGAIREDDIPFDAGALENNPQDDPEGSFTRVFNHFFDPVNDRPLMVALQRFGARAPDWALNSGDFSIIDNPLLLSRVHRGNHFGVPSAREAMWRALTLKKIGPSGELTDLVLPSDVPLDAGRYLSDLRSAYWATTFRALGDVLHLLQDMAQPQHTRNDPHAGMGCALDHCAAGHASYFEKYVDARATGANQFRLRERFSGAPSAPDAIEPAAVVDLNYSGYPNVSASDYRGFFVSNTGAGSLLGTGLANYSNQGFFTAGTNIDSNGGGYPSPPPNANGMQINVVLAGAVENAAGKTISGSGSLKIFKGPVADSRNQSESDPAVALSSYGAFDQFMKPLGKEQFTLNHYNYDDQARLLIPRAVAYSAGFLDYFFRGQLDISLPSAGVYAVLDSATPICKDACGFQTIKLKLKNSTPGETLSNGFFVAVVKFYRNKDYQSDLSGDPGGANFVAADARSWYEEILVSEKVDIATVAAGQMLPNDESEITFTFDAPIPINATDIVLQVVFRGTLGNESDAVLVATKDISEPNYLAFENDLDYRFDDVSGSLTPIPANPATQTFGAIFVKLNKATTPVASLTSLGVRGYAQFAFLTDLNADATEHLVIDFSSPGCCVLGSPYTVELPIATFVAPPGTSGSYDRTARHVAMYRGRIEDYTAHFFQAGPYGYAPCSEGDLRAICTSVGMTPLSSANAVAWTINFP